jgi:very-short-patch-repair endonuclease
MENTLPHIRRRARTMRKQMTGPEFRLWSWLRKRRFSGFKFRRQHPVGPYILDFYCSELKLALELDGAHHDTHDVTDYDDNRTLSLRTRGIEVLRIPNELWRRIQRPWNSASPG